MKCQDVRRFLYAFNDGALEVKDNLEILGHLNMCPHCAARADADQQLKERLGKAFAAETAPASLRENLTKQLRPAAGIRRAHWLVRLSPALATAAVLLLALGFWWTREPEKSAAPDTNALAALDTERPIAAKELAAAFHAGHLQCSAKGRAHHRKDLSRHLPKLQQQLSSEFDIEVLAPNWHSESLRFVSACTCGMPDGTEGAHLVYERLHVQTASIYTLRPTGLFDSFERDIVDGDEYRVAHSEGLNLVSWRGRSAEYLLCANGDPGRNDALIRDLVTPIRIALGDTPADPLGDLVLARAETAEAVTRLFCVAPAPAMVLLGGDCWITTPSRF